MVAARVIHLVYVKFKNTLYSAANLIYDFFEDKISEPRNPILNLEEIVELQNIF